MYDSQSPFDAAAQQPFLDQPAKKKWSLFSLSSSSQKQKQEQSKRVSHGTAATEQDEEPDYDSSSYSSDDSEDDGAYSYEAPTLHEEMVVFYDHKNNGNDKEESQQSQQRLQVLNPMDSDTAVLQERHTEFGLVRDSMQQLHDIQKELAVLVNSQEDDIENMASLSIETLGQTQAGLAHLLRLQQAEKTREQRKKTLATLITTFLVIAYFFLSSGADLDATPEDGGLPQAP